MRWLRVRGGSRLTAVHGSAAIRSAIRSHITSVITNRMYGSNQVTNRSKRHTLIPDGQDVGLANLGVVVLFIEDRPGLGGSIRLARRAADQGTCSLLAAPVDSLVGHGGRCSAA